MRALIVLSLALTVGCEKKTTVTMTMTVIDAAPVVAPPVDPNAAILAEMNAMKPAEKEIELPAFACKGNGQTGPHTIDLPANRRAGLTKALAALASPETKVAQYYGDAGYVLAPIGWHCDSVMGSGGTATWILPPGVTSHEKMKGSGVAFHFHIGATSGRVSVAAIAGPLFPMIDAAAPYAGKSGETVWIGTTLARYVDDPNVGGLGTDDGDFAPSSATTAPIHGSIRAIENKVGTTIGPYDLQTIAFRVDDVALVPVIQAAFEDRSMRKGGF